MNLQPRILVVDDHPESALVLGRLLLTAGCECRTAHSCREALILAADENFDLLLTDLGLPDGTGEELLRELRFVYGLDGIALTGWDTPEILQSISDAGFLSYLIKPIEFVELRAAISRALDRPRATPEALSGGW